MRKKTIALIVTVLVCLSVQFNANQQNMITKSSFTADQNIPNPPIKPPITPPSPDRTPGGKRT